MTGLVYKSTGSFYKIKLENGSFVDWTAVNLKWALNFCLKKIKKGKQSERINIAFSVARTIRNNDIIKSKKIAFNGYKIIEKIYRKKKKK